MVSQKIIDDILTYPKLARIHEEGKLSTELIQKLVREIHGTYNAKVVDFTKRVIDKTFLSLYDGIHLDIPEGLDLHKLKEKYHVALVPNHQSHADYVAITYLFHSQLELPIRVASGINLDIPLLGRFFRNTGAFFIRRSFRNNPDYKIVFEAYIFHLLKNNEIVEFFFEGGRSRTGKLLPPRFGLFQMLLEAHSCIDSEKPLCFVPVSIAHEHVPEERAHAREVAGAKKQKEGVGQLFGLIKLFNKRMGTIHVRLGEGYVSDRLPLEQSDASVERIDPELIRARTQEVAFECFRAVGRGMPITPTALLSFIMLDDTSGTLSWDNLWTKAQDVMNYCRRRGIPTTPSLDDNESEFALKRALGLLIESGKIERKTGANLNRSYFFVPEQGRVKLIYFKNMVLHHFLVPCLMSMALERLWRGEFKDVSELAQYLQVKRRELRFEFYLPSVREMMNEAMDIVSYSINRTVKDLSDCFELSREELVLVGRKIRYYSTSLGFVYEAMGMTCHGILALNSRKIENFKIDELMNVVTELHSLELHHGKLVRFPESLSVTMVKSTLKFLESEGVLGKDQGSEEFHLKDSGKLEVLSDTFVKNAGDQFLSMVRIDHDV